MSKKKHRKRAPEADAADAAFRLPKSAGGVKLPKALRERVEGIVAQVNGPAGRELAAAGMMLAANALRAHGARTEAKRSEAEAPPGGPRNGKARVASPAPDQQGAAPPADLVALVETVARAAGTAFGEAWSKRSK